MKSERRTISVGIQGSQGCMHGCMYDGKFKYLVDGKYEEVVVYNDIVNHIEADCTWEGLRHFKKIIGRVRTIKDPSTMC